MRRACLLVWIAVIGCGSKKERPISEIVKDYPGAEKVVAAAEQIFKGPLPPAPTIAEIAKAGIAPNKGISSAGIKLDGPPIKLAVWGRSDTLQTAGNVTVIDAASIGDLTKLSYGKVDLANDKLKNVLTDCASLVRKQSFANPAKSADSAPGYLEACSKLEYVLVLRAVSASAPSEDTKAKTYLPGFFFGDVLVFGLASGKLLGSFLINVSESSKGEQRAGTTRYAFTFAVEERILDGLKTYAGLQ